MPAALTPKHTPNPFLIDWELLSIILVVSCIVLLEIAAALAYIRIHNLRSKARWRRLRERGVVIVDGPTLIWADDLPPQPTFSTFNLRQLARASYDRVV